MKKLFSLLTSFTFVLIGSLTSCASNELPENTLVIGTEGAYAPFNWVASEKNEFTTPIEGTNMHMDGYDIQIAKMVAEEIGYELVVKQIHWDSLIPSLNAGLINSIFAGMSYSTERDQTVDFSDQYYYSDMCVIVREDSGLGDITNIQELTGKKVISQESTIPNDIIAQIDGVIHMSPASTFGVAAQAVDTGVADAMTAEYPVALAITQSNPDLTIVRFNEENGFQGLDENSLGVNVAVVEGNSELVDKINVALATISTEEREEIMSECIGRNLE